MAGKKVTSRRKAASKKAAEGSAQVPDTRATGLESATGRAIHEAERDDIPTGADRGSSTPVVGNIQADLDNPKPDGAQTEPARFTSNGQLPHNMIPTSSGPVPAGGARSTEDMAELIDAVNEEHDATYGTGRTGASNKRLSEATVGRLGRAELIAIGQTRGYTMDINAGTRKARNDFLKGQDEDKNLTSEEEGAAYERRESRSKAKKTTKKR